MEEIRVEVCIISARGLPRASSFWKHQWFAVGWIDPNEKYCTSIDSSGNPYPVWRTKFTSVVRKHGSESSFEDDAALYVEVYSRDPIFLREKLQGTVKIPLKEFLVKHGKKKNSDGSILSQGSTDVGSFQLRKKNSSKPNGFIDISIETLEEKEGATSSTGSQEGFQLTDNASNGINLNTEAGSTQGLNQMPFCRPGNPPHPQPYYPYIHPMPYPSTYTNPSMMGHSYSQAAGPSFPPPITTPLPPLNVGYTPTYLPRTTPTDVTSTYINMPQPRAAGGGQAARPAFAAGLGAGAIAAGAVVCGDSYMSGFDLPNLGFQDPTLAVSINPPF